MRVRVRALEQSVEREQHLAHVVVADDRNRAAACQIGSVHRAVHQVRELATCAAPLGHRQRQKTFSAVRDLTLPGGTQDVVQERPEACR